MKFIRSNRNKKTKINQMIINSKNWDTSLSTQIAHYNHIKGWSNRPVSFKKCIVRFKNLVLTLKVCSSEPNGSKYVRVESFIFLKSTLISKILLRKLDWTRARLWQRKKYWSIVSIPAPQEYIGLTVSLKLCRSLCSLGWLKFNRIEDGLVISNQEDQI